MKTLDEAWFWYCNARQSLTILQRLAADYWDEFPWDDPSKTLREDELLLKSDAPSLAKEAGDVLSHLGDIAVVVLFSVFEATVRTALATEVNQEIPNLKHPYLQWKAKTILKAIEIGNVEDIIMYYGKNLDKTLIEDIRKIRDYRNWVAHGRSGAARAAVEPKAAYELLRQFLEAAGLAEASSLPMPSA
jgi:hypothetical protein